MIIKRLEEFDNLNEGFLSSLFSGFKDLFTTKKGKIENILKKIKEVRSDEVQNAITVEKEIQALPKENTPEYKFAVTNLRRQARVYSSLKGDQINSLFKEARDIMEDDPKLEAFFASEVANIEVETKEKLLKSVSGGSDSTYLKQINDEFEALVKDANKKKNYYEGIKEMPSYFPSVDVPEKMSEDVITFLNMSTKEASTFSRALGENDLNKYYTQVKDFFFDLEDKYSTAIDRIRRDRKMAEKQGQDWIIPSLEKEEMNVKYHLRKSIDKLRSRVNTLEKEMKNRRYAKSDF